MHIPMGAVQSMARCLARRAQAARGGRAAEPSRDVAHPTVTKEGSHDARRVEGIIPLHRRPIQVKAVARVGVAPERAARLLALVVALGPYFSIENPQRLTRSAPSSR